MENNRFLALIEKSIKENWDFPALNDYKGDSYLYKDFAEKIAELHIIFEALDLKRGDKVALCGRNSANWAVTLFATLSYGAVGVSILHDFNNESIQNIVNHSDAKVLFAGEHIWEKLDPDQMPQIETIFLIEDFSVIKSNSKNLLEMCSDKASAFKKKYPDGYSKEDINYHIEQPDELAILNYTSGTTSNPKGVMIPYRSLWSNMEFAIDNIPFVKPHTGIVSMLPMAHMYGLAFEILLSIAKGCQINFLTRVPSPQVIMEAFSRVNPSLIIAVPLIIEKVIKNKVFVELNKQPVRTLLKIPYINRTIYKKVLNQLLTTFGGKLEELVIGGAALNKEVGNFLTKIKFPYTVGYGMTECGPLISYIYWDKYSPGSCGRIIDRMEIKIDSPDPENIAGEILVKGMNVMLGYYKNPEETADAFTKDGWLKTGDLGVIDKEGNIFIRGRNKSLILGPSGQNIYPEEIEATLNYLPYIAESIIVEREGKLVALLVPDEERVKKDGISEEQLESSFASSINVANKRLPNYSQISKYIINKEEFEKTPKRSIRRFLYK